MATTAEIKEKLETVFQKEQAAVLTELIVRYNGDGVKATDFTELKNTVQRLAISQEELTVAQKRTEVRVEELTVAMNTGFNSLRDQISALGSRWGIYNEATFRATIRGVLSKQGGVQVTRGYYGDREVDVIIRNGEHIMLEITSRTHSGDIDKLLKSGEDYEKKHGTEPVLMIASTYISPKIMRRIMSLPQEIEIFSYEDEEE